MLHLSKTNPYTRAISQVGQIYFWIAALIVLYIAMAGKQAIILTIRAMRWSKEAYWQKFTFDPAFE